MEEIFRSDKISQFWPTEKQTPKERALATTRFILYASCILYLIRRDVRILLVGGAAMFAVYYMYKNGMIKDTEYRYVKKPLDGNVMNNGLDGPPDKNSLKAAWDKIHPFMEDRWFAEYNFYTAPELDNEKFIKNAYSRMMMPVCRDNPEFCDINNSMGRGMEEVQMRGTFGASGPGATRSS
jgi:hypothetical protein